MNGIELKSGVNNCRWNVDGRCTNPDVTRNEIPEAFSRDWDSKQNCSLTIIGQFDCGGYEPDKAVRSNEWRKPEAWRDGLGVESFETGNRGE